MKKKKLIVLVVSNKTTTGTPPQLELHYTLAVNNAGSGQTGQF
jgi:hypothetical protein